jgi:uncharacterized membrane protein
MVVAQKSAENTNMERKMSGATGGVLKSGLFSRGPKKVIVQVPARMYARTIAVCKKPIFQGAMAVCRWKSFIVNSVYDRGMVAQDTAL